jgi:hypothetical protein
MTKYLALRSRSREARKQWSRNAVSARARKRIERAGAELPDEPAFISAIPRVVPDAIIMIRLPKIREAKTFRVHRDGEKFLALGKVQAASTIGKRVALVLKYLA